jgi:hypothetical protein
MSMSDLPSREALRKATDPWWEGTSLQQTLVDVLRGARATLEEATATAQKLAERAPGSQFLDRTRIEEAFDLVRANRRWQVEQRSGPPKFDPRLCIFADRVRCPNCGEIHGHLLTHEELSQRMREYRETRGHSLDPYRVTLAERGRYESGEWLFPPEEEGGGEAGP